MREHNSYSCILELKDEDPEVLEDCTSMDFKTRRSTRMALKIWRSIYWFEKLPKSNFWYRCIKKQRYWISQRVTKNSKQKVKSNQRTSDIKGNDGTNRNKKRLKINLDIYIWLQEYEIIVRF